MNPKRKNKKDEIMAATVRLVARNGVKAATIRQISTEAGVTEGALYRHFSGKEDLCHKAYSKIVLDMAAAKGRIITSGEPVREQIREWVRISYEYFDRYPDAFTYVLLTDHDFPEEQKEITTLQGRLFMRLIEQGQRDGELMPMPPKVALSHFTGMMLNLPRLINEKILDPPASQYVDEVVAALWRVFQLDK